MFVRAELAALAAALAEFAAALAAVPAVFRALLLTLPVVEFAVFVFRLVLVFVVMLVFVRFALAFVLPAVSPHAMPKALNAKRDESAITFFITK